MTRTVISATIHWVSSLVNKERPNNRVQRWLLSSPNKACASCLRKLATRALVPHAAALPTAALGARRRTSRAFSSGANAFCKLLSSCTPPSSGVVGKESRGKKKHDGIADEHNLGLKSDSAAIA